MIKRGFALLKEKADYRNLMGAQFLAQAGDGIVQTALGAAIVFGGQKGFDLESAQDPQDLLRIALTIFVPYTVLSPFLGVVIDRWDRRRLLFVANGLRALVIKGAIDVEPIALAGALVYGLGALFALLIKHPGETREKSTLGREVARVVQNIVAGFREVGRTPKAGAAITTYFWLRFLWSFSLVGIGFVARELLADDDLVIAALTGGAGAARAVLGFLTAGV